MEFTPEVLIKKLKKREDLPNVLYVAGEEHYYRKRITEELTEYVFSEVDAADREITVFDKDTNIKEVANSINTYPFFCGKSLIIIKDEKLLSAKEASEKKKETLSALIQVLQDVPEYCYVLVSAGEVDKRTKLFKICREKKAVCLCESFKVNFVDSWLVNQAALHDSKFTPEAIAVIKEYLAPVDKVPLQILVQEIEKLSLYAGERKVWTEEDVKIIFTALPEVSSFSLTNAICNKELKEMLELLAYEKKKGTYILKLCGFINASIKRLAAVKELQLKGYSPRQIAAEKGISPYAINIVCRQANAFEYTKLKQFLLDITYLNSNLRQGGRQYELLEEVLIKLLS